MSSDTSTTPIPGPGPSGHHAGFDTAPGPQTLVEAVRRYRDAETAMRGTSRDSMQLGRTDMAALRLLLRADRSGTPLKAAALARDLEISTAATTVLVDRLVRSGHAERRRSATDRRAVEIWPTPTSDAEVRSTMGVLHERMMQVVAALSPEETRAIHRFLVDLGRAMADLDVSDPVLR